MYVASIFATTRRRLTVIYFVGGYGTDANRHRAAEAPLVTLSARRLCYRSERSLHSTICSGVARAEEHIRSRVLTNSPPPSLCLWLAHASV